MGDSIRLQPCYDFLFLPREALVCQGIVLVNQGEIPAELVFGGPVVGIAQMQRADVVAPLRVQRDQGQVLLELAAQGVPTGDIRRMDRSAGPLPKSVPRVCKPGLT